MVYELYWNGVNGTCHANGRYGVITEKPSLGFAYDVIFYNSENVMQKSSEGAVVGLTEQEKTACMQYAIDNSHQGFPSGGASDAAIVNILTSGTSNVLTMLHGDGSNSLLNLGPAIQNTPAYDLAFKNAGLCSNMTTSTNYLNDGFAVGGLGGVGIKTNRIYLTKKAFTTGGYQNGGTYDAETNTFTVSADNVAIKAQCAWAWGFHPSWPKFSSGRPAGATNSGFIVEFFDEVTQAWVDVASKVVKHGSTASWPNSANPSWNSSEAHVTFSAPKAGKYRIAFFISSVWTTPLTADDWKYCRFWAYANGFASSQVDNYWQLTGSIKDVATAVPIPPYKP